MLEKEILDKLSYSECSCPIDYRPEIGVINEFCLNHTHSKLLVHGIRLHIYQRLIKERARKIAFKHSEIL